MVMRGGPRLDFLRLIKTHRTSAVGMICVFRGAPAVSTMTRRLVMPHLRSLVRLLTCVPPALKLVVLTEVKGPNTISSPSSSSVK
jgi:hypothetical protein